MEFPENESVAPMLCCRNRRKEEGEPPSGTQFQCQCKKTRVCRYRYRRQDEHHVAAGPKLFPMQPIIPKLREKLLVPLLSSKPSREEDAGSVDGE